MTTDRAAYSAAWKKRRADPGTRYAACGFSRSLSARLDVAGYVAVRRHLDGMPPERAAVLAYIPGPGDETVGVVVDACAAAAYEG